jgi:hypothetical protein
MTEGARAAIHIQAFKFSATEASGEPSSQAGAHPSQVTAALSFTDEEGPRNITFDLPPGLIGIPAATPTCREPEFQIAECSPESQIGYLKLVLFTNGAEQVRFSPLFNLEPIPGAAAEFGINTSDASVRLRLGVRTGADYGISVATKNLSQALIWSEAVITLWGVPAVPSHDGLRGECLSPDGPTGGSCPSEAVPLPLLTNPSSCLPVLSVTASVDSWEHPGVFDSATSSNEDGAGDPVGIDGCESLGFRPTLSVRPSVPMPGAPSGMTFELHTPQVQDPDSPAEATLDKATVTLPRGVAISPPAAAGLGACAPDQIRLADDSQPSCPDASKLGAVTIETPMLANPLRGSVYLARPGDNPFGSRLALYGVAAADGVLIKLAGRVVPDPLTGQLRVTFDDVPQLPFSEVKLTLFDGPRAPLTTPPRCGTFTTESELTAWGALAPVTPSTSFELSSGCSGPRFAPSLRAGAVNPVAGAYSPFVLKLQRGDHDGDFASSFSLDLPAGVSAALKGTTYCPEAALAAPGSLQPDCPSSSRVGSAVVAAGLGASPLYLTGEVYLSGPDKGAPFSLAAIVPARAGPVDLGTIVERIAIDIDPRSGRLSARADGLPQIRDGIPLELRSLSLNLDRPGFIRNPTSCDPLAITGTATTGLGQSAALFEPFRVGGCSALPFKPRLALDVLGGVARGGHPALRAVLRAGPQEAGIAASTITLPAGELLDLRHVGAVCARQLPPERCPRSSRLGRARVWSPLLDDPLEGAIYLRAPSGRLPDLLVDLRGGGLHLVLRGQASARAGRLRIRFPALPDVPIDKAEITLAGGRRGILVNSEALCARPRRAEVELTAHTTKHRQLRPLLRLPDLC